MAKPTAKSTESRVEQYYGLLDLLKTWEAQPDEVQIAHHADILRLRGRIRTVKNYILHRKEPLDAIL